MKKMGNISNPSSRGDFDKLEKEAIEEELRLEAKINKLKKQYIKKYGEPKPLTEGSIDKK